MDVSRLILVAASAFVLALPVTHAQDDDAVATGSAPASGPPKPWRQVRGFGRVLDLSKPPVVIDEPGLYAIRQDWRFPRATPVMFAEGLIQVTADDVTLDLHGFTISAESPGESPPTLLVIAGHSAEVRNGGIEAHGIVAAVRSTGIGPWLHHLSIISGHENSVMTFEGDRMMISDSQITGAIRLAGASKLERNTIRSSRADGVWLNGDGNRVMDNRLFPFRADIGVRIVGNGNVVANNVMDAEGEPSFADTGFGVDGDHNVLRGNTVLRLGRGTILRIGGTGNTLDGNIAPPPPPDDEGPQARIGMEFTADGNFYGDNRMAAEVPFALGGTVQTDWGGNAGY